VELAQQMEGEDMFDVTAEMPAAADNDEFVNDLEDTGIREELTINDELTVDMQVHDDATVEMDIESGSVDTKKAAR